MVSGPVLSQRERTKSKFAFVLKDEPSARVKHCPKQQRAALDKVKDPEARELLIVIMDKCIV